MTGRWILIPGDGLGGTDLEGQKYYCKAVMTYFLDGQLKETQTDAVEITVHPQPKLYLHYYVPRDVFADIPFKLGVLVENEGDGYAYNFKIDSGQPEIVENFAGLLIDFRIVSSSFGSKTGDIVRLVLGDIAPHSTAHGYWIMQCTLDGKFVEFTAELTHRAYKGVQINPLILDVTTEIIERDNLFADAQDPNNNFSLIDRDEDGFPDYLINLWSGLRLPIEIPQNVTVSKEPSDTDRTMVLEVPETAGYVCIVLPDQYPEWNYRSVKRHGAEGAEDTYLSGNNFWRAHGNIYFVDELGYVDPDTGLRVPTAGTYTLDFRSALTLEELNVAPKEFNIVWSDDAGAPESLIQYLVHDPPEGSALTTYEIEPPVFYIDIPPTVGQKAAVQAVVTNDGVLPESGEVEFYVTPPDGPEVRIASVPVEELFPWRHERPVIEWVPQTAGEHILSARLTVGGVLSDSPDNELTTTVTVNDPPYADAGVAFHADVRTPATFDGSRSLDEDGYLRTFFWDFGDGVWGGGMTPTHTYEHSGTYEVRLIVKDDDGAMDESAMMLVTIDETRADLEVQDVTVIPVDPELGPQEDEDVTIAATIRNGGYAALDETFYVGFYIDGAFTELVEIAEPLPIGGTTDVSFPWHIAIGDVGNHLFTVVADDMEDLVDEANEDNNERTAAMLPDQVYFPDLVPVDVALSVTESEPTPWAQPILLIAHVENQGTAAAGAFRVSFYVDAQFVGYDVVGGLGEGAAAAASIEWVPTAGEHRAYVFVDYPLSHVVESNERNNTYAEDIPELNIIYGDLAVESVELWPGDARVNLGDYLRISAYVTNSSDVEVPVAFDVRFYVGDEYVGSETIDAMAPREGRYVFVHAPVTSGHQDVRVVVDEDGAVPEANEDNNARVLPSVPVQVLYADLAVGRLTWTPSDPTYGETARFSVRIDNLGSGRVGEAFNVELWIDDELIAVRRQGNPILAGGSAYWLVDWTADLIGGGAGTVTVRVDPLNEIAESDEANNVLSAPLQVDSGFVADVTTAAAVEVLLSGPGDEATAWTKQDVSTYATSDRIVFAIGLAASDAPETPLGAGEATAALTVRDGGGAEVYAAPMIYDADRGEFVVELPPSALPEGDYTATIAVTVGGTPPGPASASGTPVQETAAGVPLEKTLAFSLADDFEVTVATDRQVYAAGEVIAIGGTVQRGETTGVDAAAVEILVVGRGSQRVFETTTAPDGTYALDFLPLPGQGGVFTVTASVELDGVERTATTGFQVQGPQIAAAEPGATEVPTNGGSEVVLMIRNVGSVPMTGLVFALTDEEPGDLVDGSLDLTGTADVLDVGEETTVRVQIDADVAAATGTTVRFTVDVGSAEGLDATFDVETEIVLGEPLLVVTPMSIDLGVERAGEAVTREITLTNDGYAEMTGLDVTVPALPWLALSGAIPASLAVGEAVTLTLTIEPGAAVGFGFYEESITLSHAGGSVTVDSRIEVTDRVLGMLEFWATDDMGFHVDNAEIDLYLESSPYLSSADAAVVAACQHLQAVTNSAGRYTFTDILAGTYSYTVQAAYHEPAEGSVVLQPGETAQSFEAEMEFRPYQFDWGATSSQQPQTLGQLEMNVVMTADDAGRPALVPNKPAGEYFIKLDSEGEDYAVLFSGGTNSAKNAPSNYDTLKELYLSLVRFAGLKPENIYVLCSDGRDPGLDRDGGQSNSDWSFALNVEPATAGGLYYRLASLSSRIGQDDNFLFFAYGDGWGYAPEPDLPSYYMPGAEGITDEEELLGWNGDRVRDELLGQYLNEIHAKHATYIFGGNFSGGMIDELDLGEGEFAAAATNHYEFDRTPWAGLDHFAGYFIRGLATGRRSTHDLFQYAYNQCDTHRVELGGPGGPYNLLKQHPWKVGADFDIFNGTGLGGATAASPTVHQTRDSFSINNLGDEDITGVQIHAVNVPYGAVDFGDGALSASVAKVDPHSSFIFSIRINTDALWSIDEDTILDGGYLQVSGWRGTTPVQTIIPIRIRVGANGGLYNGEPYVVTPFVGPWPSGPVLYGSTFIETWFDGVPSGGVNSIGRLGISQEISLEEEVFTASLTLRNVTLEHAMENVHAEVIITDVPLNADGSLPAGGTYLNSRFDISETSPMNAYVGGTLSTTGVWRIKPLAGAGGDAGGTYYVHVRVRFSIEGRDGAFASQGRQITVQPAPALMLRYGVPVLGQPLETNETFRINVTVTNTGTGTAKNLKIAFPDVEMDTSITAAFTTWSVSNFSPRGADLNTLSFGDLAPGQTKEGWWEVFVTGPCRVAALTTSYAANGGSQATVELGSPIKETLVGAHTQDDLANALTALYNEMKEKLDTDVNRVANYFGEIMATRQDMELIATMFNIVTATNQLLSLMWLCKTVASMATPSFHPASLPVGSPVLSAMGTASSNLGDAINFSSVVAPFIQQFLDKRYGYGDAWKRAMDEIIERANLAARARTGNPNAEPDADELEDAFRWYVQYKLTVWLPLDYLLWDELGDLTAGATHAELASQLEQLLEQAGDEWPSVNGTEALWERIRQNMLDAYLTLTNGVLPAYYPVDAMYEQLVKMTEDLDRAGTGLGVGEYNTQTGERVRTPTVWYSVGEKGVTGPGEWLPVHMTGWEFGTTYEPSYVLNKLLEHQYFQFSLHYQLIQLKWAVTFAATMGNLIGVTGPAGAGLALINSVTAMAADISLDLASYQIYQAEIWGYEHLTDRLLRLLNATAKEQSGLWRMSHDVLNYITYLDERQLVDPAVPLFVESIDTPNIEIADGELIGHRTGHVVVRNDYASAIEVRPILNVFSLNEDIGGFSAPTVTIPAGEVADLDVLYGGILSSMVDVDGYEAVLYLEAIDPATMSTVLVGPWYTHFYVGTQDELIQYAQQPLRVALAGEINRRERREVAIDPAATTRRMRVLLVQDETSDLDLHLYDGTGAHVGWNDDTESVDEEIAGATYSGVDANVEWIEVVVPAGAEYTLAVEAVACELDALFAVSVLEAAEMPAVLQSLNPAISHNTNQRDVELALGAAEFARQRGVVNLAVDASDLADGQGGVIPASAFGFDLPETAIPAGGQVYFAGTLTIPLDAADGTYTGTLTLLGEDAVSGEAVSATIDVEVLLDTVGPAAPTLETVASPITGEVTLSGTTEPGTSVELLLDGEHLGYTLPYEGENYQHTGVLIPAGTHTLTAVARDEFGNASAASDGVTVESSLDLTAPETTAVVTGDQTPEGEYIVSASVELSADDEPGGSGLVGTWYSLDGGIGWAEYDGTLIVFTTEGENRLWFYSADAAGNAEEADLLTVTVQRTFAPVVADVVRNDGSDRMSTLAALAFVFDKDVIVGPGALTVYNHTTGLEVDGAALPFTYEPDTFTAGWDLSGLGLPVGHYTAALGAAGVRGAGSSLPLDGDGDLTGGDDYELPLIVTYAGDTDADGDVDRDDLAALEAGFGILSGAGWAQGDTDADGDVDFWDYFAVKRRLGDALASVPPTVAAPEINDGPYMRSELRAISLTFDKRVTVDPAGLTLHNDSTGEDVALPAEQVDFTYDPATHTARWDVAPLGLPAGYYTATLAPEAVVDTTALTLDGDGDGAAGGAYELTLLVTLPGDADLDGSVDASDWVPFNEHFGTAAGATWLQGDFDGDGDVDAADATLLNDYFGQQVDPAVPPGTLGQLQAETPAAEAEAASAPAPAAARPCLPEMPGPMPSSFVTTLREPLSLTRAGVSEATAAARQRLLALAGAAEAYRRTAVARPGPVATSSLRRAAGPRRENAWASCDDDPLDVLRLPDLGVLPTGV